MVTKASVLDHYLEFADGFHQPSDFGSGFVDDVSSDQAGDVNGAGPALPSVANARSDSLALIRSRSEFGMTLHEYEATICVSVCESVTVFVLGRPGRGRSGDSYERLGSHPISASLRR